MSLALLSLLVLTGAVAVYLFIALLRAEDFA